MVIFNSYVSHYQRVTYSFLRGYLELDGVIKHNKDIVRWVHFDIQRKEYERVYHSVGGAPPQKDDRGIPSRVMRNRLALRILS